MALVLVIATPGIVAAADPGTYAIDLSTTTAQTGDTVTLTPQPSGVTSTYVRCQIVIEGFESSGDWVWMQVASDDCAAWTFTVPASNPGHYQVRGFLYTSDSGDDPSGVVASALEDLEITAGGTPAAFTSNYPVQSWSVDDIVSDATPVYGSPLSINPAAGVDGCRLGVLGGFEQAWTQQDGGCEPWTFTLPAPTPNVDETFLRQTSDVRYYGWVGTSAWSQTNPELPFLGARWGATYSTPIADWSGDADGSYESSLPAIFSGAARDQAFYIGDPTLHQFQPVLLGASGMDCVYTYPFDPEVVVAVDDGACAPYDVPGLESGSSYTGSRTILRLRDADDDVIAEAMTDTVFILPMTPVVVEVPPEIAPGEDFTIAASNDAGVPASYSIVVEPVPGSQALSRPAGQARSSAATDPVTIEGSFSPSPASAGEAVSVAGPKLGWGTYQVTVTFTDVKSMSTSGTETITVSGIDTVKPTVGVPTKKIRSGVPYLGGKAAVRVSWTGGDATSGIARYELAQRTDGRAWTTIATTLTSPQSDRSLAPGHTYRFRVRAIDHAGNVGAWVAGVTFSLKRYSESSAAVRYKGAWKTSKSGLYWGGKAKTSTKAGAKASLTFTGRSVALVSRLGPSRGKATIYVNGTKVATVDLHATTAQGPQVVWSRSWSGSAKRVVTVRVNGTKGHPRVDVDGFITSN